MSSARLFRPVSSIARSAPPSYRRPLQSRLFHATSANMVIQVIKSQEEYKTLVLEADKPVILDAFATWCGPCKAITPLLETWSEDEPFKGKISFFKFDVDEIPDLSQELGVRAMPTFFLFKGGNKVGDVVGANPKAIQDALAKLIE